MRFRTADIDDLSRLIKLYKTVAREEGGIARLEHEVTEEYVKNFITKSLASGLIIVGENPDDPDELIAEIHGYKAGISVFDHVLGDVTILVHPKFQGKKIGRTILTIFLEEIGRNLTPSPFLTSSVMAATALAAANDEARGRWLTGLVAGRVDDLSALPLALLPIALDLRLAPIQLRLAPADFLLGLAELRRRRTLRVVLEHVGEGGRLTDQV